jgi:Cof subfamily protein (haloacid dehalogenase superfamily)
MELIVFDLDGTLLNRDSVLSDFTQETLARLHKRGIAYTVATGRTLHAARDLLVGQGFVLPQIFKNGVVIWNPMQGAYSHHYLLTESEIRHVLSAFIERDITPFIFTLEQGHRHVVYHPPLKHEVERRLVETIGRDRGLPILPVSQLPGDAEITNISALGERQGIESVTHLIEPEANLVAYMGVAIEDKNLCWVDIHHSDGSKGRAVSLLKYELGADRVLCFGDSDNDLSMFEQADEAYAPDNAKPHVKDQATAVIGHHDEDGIARFLRERFDL